MKLKQIAASIVAAAVAFSTVAFSAFAEEAKNDKLTLLSADLTAKLQTNMVFVEGIGVVDITGADFDSSENGAADEDANLDVDFDGIAYLSKENLKNWKETGVLTLEKLKADFDTTGLKWGMFHAQNGYVQLIKMETHTVEYEWGEETESEVTYRGLYKVENGEIKKICDLDTFWTTTREDGVSVGFDVVKKDLSIIYGEGEPFEVVTNVEFKMVVTQPDGKKTETVIAKADDFGSEIKLPIIHDDETGYDTYDSSILDDIYDLGHCSWSVPSGGDILANVGFAKSPISNYDALWGGWNYEIGRIYTDGTYKKIAEESSEGTTASSFSGLWGFGKNVVWYDGVAPFGGSTTLHAYDEETGKIESYGYETFEKDENGDIKAWFSTEEAGYPDWTFDIKYYSNEFTIVNLNVTARVYVPDENNPDDPTIIGGQHGTWEDVVLADGYIILLNGLKDFDNWESKTYYEKIVYQGDTEDGTDIFRFITKDGKTGYMDINEKVIEEFDATDGFVGKYAPVVKDGKAYLIDEKMNAVSTEIEADDVVAVDEDLFLAKKDDKTYFVTYGGEADEPATEVVVVDYSDNGVTASANEGVITDGAALSVQAVEDKTDDTKVTYEISFKKADGTTVQPNGTVTVKIPVPEKFSGKEIFVYRVEADGTYTNMKAKVIDNVIVFDTEHFSEYVVTTDGTLDKTTEDFDTDTSSDDETSDSTDNTTSSDSDSKTSSDNTSNSGADKENVKTGFGGIAMTIGLATLAGAVIVAARKKTR